MSALCGLEITDADIEVSSPEMPALDGGAGVYAQGLLETGFADLPNGQFGELYSRVFVQEPDAKIAISVGSGHWRYEFQTGDRWPGEQIYETDNVIAGYASEIAPARTFCFDYELPMIKQAGLAKGLDEHSAVVLGPEGYLNETLFPDEPARHKLLDAMGDLYLSGMPARFLNVVAERTGHRANVKAAQLLAEAIGRLA
jgi:UDP-3-O-[3-hydroxymyristoyl] N-acetylglucosamine deacetylase